MCREPNHFGTTWDAFSREGQLPGYTIHPRVCMGHGLLEGLALVECLGKRLGVLVVGQRNSAFM